MYSVKSGEARSTAVLSGAVTDLGSQAVAAVRQDKALWVATMDKSISCYSSKGKRVKGIVLNDDISELCVMSLKRAKASFLLLVALTSGELSIYRELHRIHSFRVDAPITALCYGSYGREENSLIIVNGKGSLTIKMWKRSADADSFSSSSGPPPEQVYGMALNTHPPSHTLTSSHPHTLTSSHPHTLTSTHAHTHTHTLSGHPSARAQEDQALRGADAEGEGEGARNTQGT
jgi:Bardet-Biedl syndrome 1 protein